MYSAAFRISAQVRNNRNKSQKSEFDIQRQLFRAEIVSSEVPKCIMCFKRHESITKNAHVNLCLKPQKMNTISNHIVPGTLGTTPVTTSLNTPRGLSS